LKELALCVSLVYVRFWHQAPLPIQTPLNDILLIEELTKYPNIAIAQAASTTFGRHLWYFSKILVGLSFFDERIRADVKTQINLQKTPKFTKCLKRLDHHPQPLSSLGLASCIAQKTTFIFDVLQLKGKEKAQDFLAKDPVEWGDNLFYQDFKMAASKMTVVNYSAERAIALMPKINGFIKKRGTETIFNSISATPL